MTAEPDMHDDVAGACAAFGLTGFAYRRFAPCAPPSPAVPAPEPQVEQVEAASPPAPPAAAEPPSPSRSPMPDTIRATRPDAAAMQPAAPQLGAVLPVPFGTLAARIAARRPAAPAGMPLRLVWDPAPPADMSAPAAPREPAQDSAPERNLGGMFRRL